MARTTLLIPGPTPLPPEVRRAMNRQMINHRGPVFGGMVRELLDGLRTIFQTANDIIPLNSTGTGGLEASIVNFLCQGDRVLSVNNGSYAERWAAIAEKYGVRVDRVKAEWGEPTPLAAVAGRLRADVGQEYRAVLVTQSETSTGVLNDVRGVREALGDHPALLMVDGVSSIGAVPIETDGWGVDVAVTASQKALMSPPGLAFVSVSDRAWKAAERSTLPKFYFDLRKGRSQIQGALPGTPFTTAVSIVFAAHAAVRLILREGLPSVFERHRRLARTARAAVRGMGLSTLAEDAYAVDTVTPVLMPQGVQGRMVAARALDAYDVVLGGGFGPQAREVVRIGHLGYTKPSWLLAGLEALGRSMGDLGHPVDTAAGLAAARQELETDGVGPTGQGRVD
jgi:aspartate aminotransferase-like enzyme